MNCPCFSERFHLRAELSSETDFKTKCSHLTISRSAWVRNQMWHLISHTHSALALLALSFNAHRIDTPCYDVLLLVLQTGVLVFKVSQQVCETIHLQIGYYYSRAFRTLSAVMLKYEFIRPLVFHYC
jgi:hypothetical protein